jgi:hypothetical protein
MGAGETRKEFLSRASEMYFLPALPFVRYVGRMDQPHLDSAFCLCAPCFTARRDRILAKTSYMLADMDALEWPCDAPDMDPAPRFCDPVTAVTRIPSRPPVDHGV